MRSPPYGSSPRGRGKRRTAPTVTLAASLPEFCLLMPSEHVLDLVQYDDNVPLPMEVHPDEGAGITATLLVDVSDVAPAYGSGAKRPRHGAA